MRKDTEPHEQEYKGRERPRRKERDMSNEEKKEAKNETEKQECAPGCCSSEQIADTMAKCCEAASEGCATKMQEMMKSMCGAFSCCGTSQ